MDGNDWIWYKYNPLQGHDDTSCSSGLGQDLYFWYNHFEKRNILNGTIVAQYLRWTPITGDHYKAMVVDATGYSLVVSEHYHDKRNEG